MARLRRSDCSGAGIRRRRRGKGFEYLDEHGNRVVDPEVLDRVRALAIPPAWHDVWVCPFPMGHLQATGTDARGRKQYLYHLKWRERQDQQKFDAMLDFARALPSLRERLTGQIAVDGMPRERVLACAVRLLDLGFFRVGSEAYAADNETYGLATMRKDHVTVSGNEVSFDYDAKGSKRHTRDLVDPVVAEIVAALKRRRGGGPELLAHKVSGRWVDVKSADINQYLKEQTGLDVTAKDFRTWNATVLAAVGLAASSAAPRSKTGIKRAETRAIAEVARYLNNTPAVCRASYIDPRVFDRFESGWTISSALTDMEEAKALTGSALHGKPEEAVIDLISDPVQSPAVEKVVEVVAELEEVAA